MSPMDFFLTNISIMNKINKRIKQIKYNPIIVKRVIQYTFQYIKITKYKKLYGNFILGEIISEQNEKN